MDSCLETYLVVSYRKGHETDSCFHNSKFTNRIEAVACAKARNRNQPSEIAKVFHLNDVFGAWYPVPLDS